MPKYIFKANNDAISHCMCESEPASTPSQADCPWCGCGWMISCSKCRKSFVYADVRDTDTPLEVLARNDMEGFSRTANPSRKEIDAWVSNMTTALKEFPIGMRLAYLDGRYFPVTDGAVTFVGEYAIHKLDVLPQFEAMTQPGRLIETLGNVNYWLDRKRPELIIVAGPNGAGKTTFANAYLPMKRERFVYINADEIAHAFHTQSLGTNIQDLRAGREMLGRIDEAVSARLDLMIETTLATLAYAQKIPRWQQWGYCVKLFYLRLSDAQQSIERVRRRVALGGHNIPEEVIRRRFAKSSAYLENRYKMVVDEWYVWDSLEGKFENAATWMD